MIAIEELLIEWLGDLGDVDGHDAGSGEVNIFINTDQPKEAFERIGQALGEQGFMSDLRAAYRLNGEDRFTLLYPAGLAHFAIV